MEDMKNFLFPEVLTETIKIYLLSASIACGTVFIIALIVNTNVFFLCAVVLLIPLVRPFARNFVSRKKVSPYGKAVLITGCDTGFGHILARRLDDLGFHVFAGCMFRHGEGAKELVKSGSDRLHVVCLNVTNDSSVEQAVNYVKDNLKENVLWAVVNNAGILDIANVHWADMSKVEQLFQINTVGVIRVTQGFLSLLKEGKGRVVTVGSGADTLILPGMVSYAMSKCAAACFSEGLALEVSKWGIHTVTIKPSIYKTPQNKREVLLSQISQTWDKAHSDIKGVYASSYLDTYTKSVIKIRDTFRNNNSNEVISAIEESIMAAIPESSYYIGCRGQMYAYKNFKYLLPDAIFVPLLRHLSGTTNS